MKKLGKFSSLTLGTIFMSASFAAITTYPYIANFMFSMFVGSIGFCLVLWAAYTHGYEKGVDDSVKLSQG